MKKALLFTLSLFFYLGLTSPVLSQNIANTLVTARVDRVESRDIGCNETFGEEYTAYVRMQLTSGTSSTACLQNNGVGVQVYGQNATIGTQRLNTTQTARFELDAWEDDFSPRCTWSPGDDCRISTNINISYRQQLPSSSGFGNNLSSFFGNFNTHRTRVRYDWRYTNQGTSVLTPQDCVTYSRTLPGGQINAIAVSLLAGEQYTFETVQGGDTYIRVISQNGYSIIAQDDNSASNGLSKIDYTATYSGLHYIEVTNAFRSPVSQSTLLEITKSDFVSEDIDFANIQFPFSETICDNESLTVFGQVFESGLTNTSNIPVSDITVEFGFNPIDNNPASWPETNWDSAIPNPGYDFSQNNDEYQYTYNPPSPGTYYYAFRYTLNGCDYVYGATNNGFWDGTTHTNGVLTVEDNHNLQLSAGTLNQTVCPQNPIDDITFTFSDGASGITISPALPPGLVINSATGTISGTPADSGVYNYTVTSTGSNCPAVEFTGTITVNDTEAPPGQTQFAAPQLALDNVPEANQYNLVYELDIPTSSDWDVNSQIPYAVNNVSQLNGNPINRVAYLMQLDTKWVWVSYDAITQNYNEIGIPVDYIRQQQVANMNVFASANSGIASATAITTGNIEFWSNCYDTQLGNNSIQGNPSTYDFNDFLSLSSPDCYGSFQIHNYTNGQTLMAFNRWSGAGANDLGIGNNNTLTLDNRINTDWTYRQNATEYNIKKLYVLTLNDDNVASPLEDIIAQCEVTSLDAPTVIDNCAGEITGATDTEFPITAQGTTVVTWTYDDGNGNTSTQTQNVIIEDTEVPTVVCQDITLYLDETGNASLGANSVNDFSATQGQGNWTYGQYFANDSANFELMPDFNSVNVFPGPDDAWNNAGNAFATPFLYDAGGHPGQDLKWAVRRWTSNMDGDIYISGDFFDVNTGGGDGANIRIFKNGTQVLEYLNIPSISESYAITLSVDQGDFIDFAIDPKFDYTFDTTHFTANIALVSGTDNCGIANYSVDNSTFNCSNIGANNSVILTVTDVNDNSNTCTAIVTVVDAIAPEVTCLTDILLTTDVGACVATITDTSLDPVVSDNCVIASITNNINASNTLQGETFDVLNNNPTTVIWIVEDTSGNITQCETVVSVESPLPTLNSVTPASFLPGDTLTLFGNNFTSTGNTVSIGGATVTPDTESVTELTFTVPADVCSDNLFVTNSCGLSTNTLPYSINPPTIISVSPNNLETVGGQTITLQGTGFSTTGMTVDIGGLTGTSVSVSGTTTLQFIAPGGLCDGTITVTNNCGTQSISAPYSVNSPQIFGISESPVVPGNELVIDGTNFNPNQNSVTVNGINAPINSESFNSITVTVPNLNNACNASIVVTTCGNKSSTAFVSPAQESEAPIFSNCPSDINLTATSADGASASWTAPTAIDNCNVASESVTGLANGSTFPIGESTITYTATDDYGNTAVCTFIVNVAGVTPSITCPANITVSNDSGQCDAVVNFAATETNGIPVSTITYSQDPGTSFPVGTTTVTATATNPVGSALCTFTVTVTDDEIPIINGTPANISVSNDPAKCDAIVNWTPATVSDNCLGATISSDYNSGDTFPLGTTTVTYTASDANGNDAVPTSFTVTITDDEIPVINGTPADITVSNDPGSCDAIVTWIPATVSDNCPGATISSDYNSGDTFPLGTTTVNYTASDAAGNNAVATSFTVTITDDEIPVINGTPADITVSNDPGSCDAIVNWIPATVSDNCPGATISSDYNSGHTFPLGTTTVIYTASDANGNDAVTTSFTVTINDTEGPTFDCPTNIVVNLNDAGNGTLDINDYNLNETDNCSNNLTIAVSQTAFTCADIPAGGSSASPSVWINEFHYDNSGSDVGEFVEVAGTAGFDLTNYSIVLYNGSNGESYGTINLSGSIDDEANGFGALVFFEAGIQNGAPDGFALIDNVGAVVEFLSYEGTFTATNGPANGSASTDVSVTETSGTDAGNSIQLNGSGSAAGDFTWTAPSADSPGSLNAGQTLINTAGGLQVTITVTDEFGNPSTCLADVTLVDAGNPIPDVANLPDIAEQCEATLTPPTATDACEGTITATTNDPITYNSQGTFTVTWTYDDGNNNIVTQSQTVTIDDTEGPTFDCPTNIVVNLNDAGNGTLDINDYNLNETDNCSNNLTIAVSQTAFTCADIPAGGSSAPPSVWINEFHYDNSGSDVGEFVEVAGTAGFDLTNYSIVLYNGSNGESYGTINLSGSIDDEGNGFGALVFFEAGIQNGAPDGFALIDNVGAVVEFLSYEGTFTATNGPANGSASTDVSVTETSGTDAGNSIQLNGSGSAAGDFTWTAPSADSPGSLNAGQTLINTAGGLQVTITVTDEFGNPSTCLADVTLVDAGNPIPDVANLPDIAEQCEATLTPPTATDACEGTITATTNDPITYNSQGTFTVTWTYDDGNNNIVTQSQTVTIDDTEGPTFDCPTNIVVNLNDAGNGTLDINDYNLNETDNCSNNLTIAVSQTAFTCADIPAGGSSASPSVWINEFHYDNSGSDVGEFVEVAGTAGFDLTNYSIVLYNGSNGESYGTINLSGSIDDEGNGFGALVFFEAGIQNGAPDGFALIDNVGAVVEFLSYEGTFTATNGPANGSASTDVSVTETSGTDAGNSIQLNGSGSAAGDFTWTAPSADSPGSLNAGQTLINTAGGLQVTITVTDEFGNPSTCLADVTLVDAGNPIPDVANLPDIAEQCEATLTPPTATDACEGTITATTNDPITYNSQGTFTVTWTYDDGNNNIVTQSQTVTIDDTEGPTFDCPTNIVVNLNDAGNGTLDINDYNLNETDNCSNNLTIAVSQTAFTCADIPAGGSSAPPSVWINEFHYDNSGSDVGEFVEVAGTAGFDLTNYSIVLYNGSNGESYGTINLSGSIDDEGNGFGALVFFEAGIQNGAPDGFALIDNVGAVVEFLSYEGTFTATNGPANGSASTDVSVTETSGTDAGNSIQLNGSGSAAGDFTWTAPSADSPGSLNAGQTLINTAGGLQVTITVTDEFGNPSTCLADVTLVDAGNPIPDVANLPDIAEQCEATLTPPTATDACEGTITATTNDPITYNSQGTFTVTWTYDDGNNNIVTQSQTVTIDDTAVPIINSTPANISVSNDPGSCDAIVNWTLATVSDNCPGATISSDYNSGDTFPLGTTTVNYTAFDAAGNNAVATSFTVTVTDDEIPVINGTPGNITVSNDSGSCDAIVNWTLATVSDNCPGATISSDYNSGDTFPLGTTTVNYTATDASGNIVQSLFTITVVDNEDPVAICPADITVSNDPGDCSAVVNFNTSFTDNCTGGSVVASPASGSTFDVGTTLVTVTATDAAGNTNTCTFNVTVIDDEAPIVDCFNLTVTLDDDGNGGIDETAFIAANGSTDNCEIASISLSETAFNCDDIGGDLDELIISEYVDGTGNNDWIEIYNGTGNTIVLGDVVNGGLVSYYSINIYTDGSTTPTTIGLLGSIGDRQVYKISHTDAPNISGNPTNNFGSPLMVFDGNDAIALSNNGVAVDVIGEIGVNPGSGWSSTSNATNATTLVRSETVQQGNVSSFVANFETEWIAFTQNDVSSLGGHTIEISDNANNVILTVTDIHGNVATCEGSVTVVDATLPEALCQNVVVQLDANGNGSTTAQAVDNGSNDACGIASLALSQTQFTCADIGANPVTLTVTDSNGNESTCTATVTVLDEVGPAVVCNPITVQLDSFGNYALTDYTGQGTSDVDAIGAGSTDACGIATMTVSPNSFTCADVNSPVTVTLTVTDINNNVSTCQTTVTVEDNVAPEAICVETLTVTLDEFGDASITPNDVDNGSNDACGIASRTLDIREFSCTDVGAPVTVVLTVTDNNGNTSTCESLVTVLGDIPTVSINAPEELPEFCQGAVLVLTTTATNAASYLWSPGGQTTESIEVGPLGGTFTVTVTSATNCSVSDTFTVAAFDESTLLSAYTILAEEEVFLHGSNLVQSGGIGATDANGLIKLHQATNVIEFGRAANIVLNQGSTIVTPIYQPAEIPFPDFVFNDQSNNASPDVTINTNQSTTLGGSVYGTITVRQGATVTFSQSDIYIDELRTFDGAAIEFSGCANVFINTKFMLAQNGTINANGNNVVMYVNEDVQIEKGSYVRARIHSNGNELLAKGPNGNGNNSGDLTQMIGLFIAKKVHGNKNVVWNADDLCAPCPISPTNAPIIGNNNDFGVDAFDVLTWPNPSDTEFNVQLKTLDLYSESYIEVFDISNKLVFTGTFKPQEVYAFGKQLEGGVYIVKVQQGQNSKTIRLVKY